MGAFESRMWAVVSVAVSFLATAYFFSVIWALGGLLVLLLLVLRSLARSTIVWDLDQTLLVSQSQGDAAPELCETIQAIDGFVMRHVDDDAIAFVTLFRPWAREVLSATEHPNQRYRGKDLRLLSGAAAQRLAYPAIQVRQHSLGRG